MASHETEPVVRLFAQEVPEIASGVVEIKAIARKAGYRTKLAVSGHDPKVDSVGACVGRRGSRIRRIDDALGGERIDLVRWTDSPEDLIRNALQPARIDAVVLDPARHRATVFVQEDQLSLVRGRQGLNRALASQLCGWEIEVEPRTPDPAGS
jgi:N utilization substance protein A